MLYPHTRLITNASVVGAALRRSAVKSTIEKMEEIAKCASA